MSPELIKWFVGALASATVVIVGAVAWLASLVFKVGLKYGAVETQLATIERAGEKFERANERLERIPVIETKLDTIAEAATEDRRRFNSVMPEVQSKLTTLWEKVFSINEWRKSRPNINGGGE